MERHLLFNCLKEILRFASASIVESYWRDQPVKIVAMSVCAVCGDDIDEPGWLCCGFPFCCETHMEEHQTSDEHEEVTP